MLKRAALMVCAFVIFARPAQADDIPLVDHLEYTRVGQVLWQVERRVTASRTARLLWRLEGRRLAVSIHLGMTREEVESILGGPQIYIGDLLNDTTITYVYSHYGLGVHFVAKPSHLARVQSVERYSLIPPRLKQ